MRVDITGGASNLKNNVKEERVYVSISEIGHKVIEKVFQKLEKGMLMEQVSAILYQDQ